MRITRVPAFLLFCIAVLLGAQQAPDGLQFNVPYICPDGQTYVVHRCDKGLRFEACFYQKNQDSERYNTRQAVAAQMKKCRVQGQAPPRVSESGVPPAVASGATHTAAASSDYVAEMPSVDRVKNEIKGSDPTDTLARQVAVFSYLQTYLLRIRDARHYGGPFTPAEKKLFEDYYYAGYQLSQDFGKSHTPAEVKSFNLLEGRYEINNALNWIKQLEGKRALDAYQRTEASLADSARRNLEQYQPRKAPEHSNTSIFGIPVSDSQGILAGFNKSIENDPKVRRCLELGGSLEDCKDSGTIRAVEHWTRTESSKPPEIAGVVLVGDYRGRSGASVSFGQDLGDGSPKALLQNCGSLAATAFADTREYTIRKAGNTVQIAIANQPEPIVITMQPDGNLLGPGSVLVKGRVITGYSTTTTTVMVDGARADALGYYCNPGPCTRRSLPTPNFVPKIERCTIGSMAFAPPKLAHAPQTGNRMPDAVSETKPLMPGFRMTGRYVGDSGLTLDFDNNTATLDCGKAHAKAPYTVDNTPAGFVVHVLNAGGGFQLAVVPDMTLRGSGSTTVNGKLISNFQGENISFVPHSESCNIGALAPRSTPNTTRGSESRTNPE